MTDIRQLRQDYRQATLDESAVGMDPFSQFGLWFQHAVDSGIQEPNAMTLATAGQDGDPAARIVLLKGFDPDGFTFFTNYGSAKADHLVANPRAALLFYWKESTGERRLLLRLVTVLPQYKKR